MLEILHFVSYETFAKEIVTYEIIPYYYVQKIVEKRRLTNVVIYYCSSLLHTGLLTFGLGGRFA